MSTRTRKWQLRWGMVMCMLMAGVAHASGGSVTYVYTDPQGTPLAEADANGNITATYDYMPYGSQALGTAPNGPGYTGHVNDPDTGLVYMQARYYDPSVGRFLSTDPVTPTAGNAFNFSRYAYANNNPIVNTDPDGRQDAALEEQSPQPPPSLLESVKNRVTNLAYQIASDGKTLSGANLNATAGDFTGALVRTVAMASPLALEGGAARFAMAGSETAFSSSELRFSQTTASPFFSSQGSFAGQSIADVAGQLRAGSLSASDVPVQTVSLGRNPLIVNTRSALSLMQSGTPQSGWSLIDMTGHAGTEAQITQRLSNNGLSTNGTDVLRITGSGSNTSTLVPGQPQ
ncbi:RHS repeat-associated core domain-containing protein [Rhodanobacter sp. C03]|uniref:RHS repeat-associated core domain-containing protein n=1 Tax=Rhodanobacter sp. C03 TaxID=1945858 RepID=UPI00143C4F79|nr:RHS repeat-associated core domain-containing protein [Rhodanobacter sp. C03]